MSKAICNIDMGDLRDQLSMLRHARPSARLVLGELEQWIDRQQPAISDARCGNCGAELFNPAVGPGNEAMAHRLREAADTIAELNALQGFKGDEYAMASPRYLRKEADRMEAEQ